MSGPPRWQDALVLFARSGKTHSVTMGTTYGGFYLSLRAGDLERLRIDRVVDDQTLENPEIMLSIVIGMTKSLMEEQQRNE